MTKRRKPAFTKTELKTYESAMREAGREEWTVERVLPDGSIIRFVCGAKGASMDQETEWDRHERA